MSGAQNTLLLCDIDGVLAPIVENPSSARVPESGLELLRAALETCAAVGCVTGRAMDDAAAMVPLDGLWLAACHGMHLRSPDGDEQLDEVARAARPQLDLTVTMAKTVGWRFEDKGLSVTLHFRHVANPEQTARQMRAQISTVLDPTVVELHDARMALEVRPVGAAGKGAAVRQIAAACPQAARLVYLGDDRTDLHAFDALEQDPREGVKVAVSSREAPPQLLERADVVLTDQTRVEAYLQDLLEA